ncbi:FLOWERING LOCUS D [Olea europaea subsp. europaea]|uniref:FLOWERING LOCUS D n=1 Tax=Olea europaea subsp. europaea TaxID=158383 RepID=A0A8S0UES8_OLEEU|nr:FLOWERING LOCUS D [Olea europaea subsp. europaea]
MESSNQTLHSRVTNESSNPLQFTIHLPSSNPNFNSSSNSDHPNLNPYSVQNHFLSQPIPRRKRRGRPRNPTMSTFQVHRLPSLSNASSFGNELHLTSDQINKNQARNLHSSIQMNTGSISVSGNLVNKTVNVVSDEIIVINDKATDEASTALSAGFPGDSLIGEEIDAEVVKDVGGIEQVNYILIRNHIISRWRDNSSKWLTKDMFVDCIPKHCGGLLDSAYDYLVSHGYINFGVAPAIKERIPLKPSKPSVIVIGAGLSGLAAARQLMTFGFKVTVLEGRKRAGGRVYSKKLEGNNIMAAADLGGSVLTGTLGNPLGILARQLSYTLHKVRDKCPLYRVDGKPVDPILDDKVEIAYNQLLEKVSMLRKLMGDVSQDVSLGAALETFWQVHGDAVSEEEMKLFNWHLANLEYANAGLLSKLSLAFWDQDDPYDMGGDHCFLTGGNGKLVEALADNVPVLYEKTVQAINYGSDGVQVFAGNQVYEGDMALCTVPLGVLKSGSIKFVPELPQRKLDAIKRLGFGLLNKVAMLFPEVFWGTDLDTFGHLTDDPICRGEFFLFYSYATVAGGPLLIALVAGEAAHNFETMPPPDAVEKVLQILKDIYEPQGIKVPDPIQTVCTRWGIDPLCLGSYSNVAVGASGDDYDIMAESVGEGRLFFAGEATSRRYPATMHGAFLSGFREAANMANCARARVTNVKLEKNPSKNAYDCACILADLFREPDLEFGSFSVIFGRKDFDSMAILRVSYSGPRKKPDQQQFNQLLFEQLQSHFNQQQEFHLYTMLSKQQALELREVRGGDAMRLNYLCENLGVKLIGRKGLGPAADSVIASIKVERSKGRPTSSLKPGTSKSKAASMKQKLIRKAKIVGNKNRSSLPNAKVDTEVVARVSSTRLNPGVESREAVGNSNVGDISGAISQNLDHNIVLRPPPSTDFGGVAFSSNNSQVPPNSDVGTMFVANISSSSPQNLGHSDGSTPSSNIGTRALSTHQNLDHSSGSTPSPNIGTRAPSSLQNSGHSTGLTPSSNIGTRALSSPQNLVHSGGSIPSSDIGTRALSAPQNLDYTTSDINTVELVGITGDSKPGHFGTSNSSIPAPSSNIGTTALNSNSSLVLPNSSSSSSNPQNYAGEILYSHNGISTEENIFADIINELLPPSAEISYLHSFISGT